jgi:hypothetical protein
VRRAPARGLTAVFAVLAATLVTGTALAQASGARAKGELAGRSLTQVSVKIGGPVPVHPIGTGFLGLSLEYSAILPYAGTNPHAINPVLVQLIRNLTAGRSTVLRIGGDSSDWSWWPVAHVRRPLGIRYDILPAWMASARALAQATNAQLILGLNLEADSARILVAEAHALLAGLGRQRISALEIGNEPELYPVRLWFDPPGGPQVRGRAPSYNFNSFLGEFTRFRKLLPRVPIAGPSVGNYDWLRELPRFLSAQPKLGVVSFHRYGLRTCGLGPGSPSYATVPRLLGTFASRGMMTGVARFIDLAHRHDAQFRIDEMNSVTCGGRLGVSNTLSVALWVLDALFNMAHAGVDGVNIHTFPRSDNELFDFAHLRGHWIATTIRPEYYGLALFAQAAPAGSLLLSAPASRTPGRLLRSWATRGADGLTRVLLINASLHQSYTTVVRDPAAPGAATIERLQAPSAYSTSGVTIGARRFDSRTGRLGFPRTSTVAPSAGEYVIPMPRSSAALVTIPKP